MVTKQFINIYHIPPEYKLTKVLSNHWGYQDLYNLESNYTLLTSKVMMTISPLSGWLHGYSDQLKLNCSLHETLYYSMDMQWEVIKITQQIKVVNFFIIWVSQFCLMTHQKMKNTFVKILSTYAIPVCKENIVQGIRKYAI